MTQDTRSSIIDAVKTPLGFLVLVLLVVDGTVASLALALADYRAPLVWTFIISLPVFLLTVVGLALGRPEALHGVRPLQTAHAQLLARDLLITLDGPFSNLEPAERAEAWATLTDVFTYVSKDDATYFKFCEGVAQTLRTRTEKTGRKLRTQGPIE
jgi:hypothetical protein